MSLGPAVQVRYEDREVEFGTTTVGVRYPLKVAHVRFNFCRSEEVTPEQLWDAWLRDHEDAEILSIQPADDLCDYLLVIFRERETQAEAGEEDER